MKISILHLDLGIGGAEKLIVSLGLAIKNTKISNKISENKEKKNAVKKASSNNSAVKDDSDDINAHELTIYTTHHDKKHCFEETLRSDQLGDCIRTYGDWLPRHLFGGRFTALCATIRMCYLSICVLFKILSEDGGVNHVVILDGVSSPLLLFLFAQIPTLFYCHFPDKLLCYNRNTSIFHRFYRGIMDFIEEFTMKCASVTVVNSKFTRAMFQQSFPSISQVPEVLYPVVEFPTDALIASAKITELEYLDGDDIVFVSLNRYERKKNIELAIEALAFLKSQKLGVNHRILLVIAGGYDTHVPENVEYAAELEKMASSLGLNVYDEKKKEKVSFEVVFRRSISNNEKIQLLLRATALLYTPENEHFGIVPIESMYLECPVIATASGGPLETVDHEVTGFLCSTTGQSFGEAMTKLLQSKLEKSSGSAIKSALSVSMGAAGKRRVTELFSPEVMKNEVNLYLQKAQEQCHHQKNSVALSRKIFFLVIALIEAFILWKFIL